MQGRLHFTTGLVTTGRHPQGGQKVGPLGRELAIGAAFFRGNSVTERTEWARWLKAPGQKRRLQVQRWLRGCGTSILATVFGFGLEHRKNDVTM